MEVRQPRMWRSRWAAIGAAVAVTLGAGGLVTTFADSPASNFVAISPVRVLDTRLPAMAPALISAQPRLLDVTGAIPTVGADGSTITTASPVPDGATAIVANVTIVSPTTQGFVSVRPGTATGAPTTSSLNAASPGVIVPNSVTVELPTTGPTAGQLQLWFQGTAQGATTDLLVDIVGYYQPPAPTTGGQTYIGSFEATVSTGIGPDDPPAPPDNYTATFELTPGRYQFVGDVTVRNDSGATPGVAACQLYVNNTAVGRGHLQDVAALLLNGGGQQISGFANISFDQSYQLTTDGPTTVSFRCVRLGTPAMSYTEMNLTVYRVG